MDSCGSSTVLENLNIFLCEEDNRTTTCICSRVYINAGFYINDKNELAEFDDRSSSNTADEIDCPLEDLHIGNDEHFKPYYHLERQAERNSDSEYITIDESDEMSALGLPTAFGKKPRRRNNQKSRVNKEIFSKYALPALEASNEVRIQNHTIDSAKPILTNLGYFFENSTPGEAENAEDDTTVSEMNEIVETTEIIQESDTKMETKNDRTTLSCNESSSDSTTLHLESTTDDDDKSDENSNNDCLEKESVELFPILANKKPKKKSAAKRTSVIPKEILDDRTLMKYWIKRYSLFSLYDQGIQLDRESWFSVTPECIAQHIAERLKCDLLVDAFCGAGGNTIQFAKTCKKVIAIDIDPMKIEMAKHNAKIYGVDENIEFIVGDFLQLCGSLKADNVFLSPPWGGPSYKTNSIFDVERHLLPIPATPLFEICSGLTKNIAFFLPKNSNSQQLLKLAGIGNKVELEQNFLHGGVKAITAYYGNLVKS